MATKQEQIDFINRIAPIIKKIGNERGYKIVSPFIAMACKEGNFGQSLLAKKYHNHFGMKAGSSWIKANKPVVNLKTMEEYTVGQLTQITDGFRVYSDDVSGVNGFFDFLSSTRYKKVKEMSNVSALATIQAVKDAGYCTSSTYVNSVMKDYISKFNLTQYDGNEVKETKTSKSYPTLALNMKDSQLGGKYIESWQRYLATLDMYRNEPTGVFDTATYYAVRRFQEFNGLKVDGIIGQKTWMKSPAWEG